jgi:hypothetical protein
VPQVFKRGWFTELSPDDEMWPGQALSLEVAPTPSHRSAAPRRYCNR